MSHESRPPPRSLSPTCSSNCAPPRRCSNKSPATPASSTPCRPPIANACSRPWRACTTLTTASAARQRRAAARERRATHARESDAVLHETGIRALRRKPVFTAPAFFPPVGFSAQDVTKLEDSAGDNQGPRTEPQASATFARPSTSSSTTSTTSCARPAHSSTSASARNWPTCAAASRCSPAVASRSATRRGSSCCARAHT